MPVILVGTRREWDALCLFLPQSETHGTGFGLNVMLAFRVSTLRVLYNAMSLLNLMPSVLVS
jgi:hypothetical protein